MNFVQVPDAEIANLSSSLQDDFGVFVEQLDGLAVAGIKTDFGVVDLVLFLILFLILVLAWVFIFTSP